MGKKVVTLCKFVGTVSLGLLTGLSYSLSSSTVPTLLALPTASSASRAYEHLKSVARANTRALSYTAQFFLLAAFFISPSRARHPYLVWTAALTGLGHFGLSRAFEAKENVRALSANDRILRRAMLDNDEELGVKSVSSETGEMSGSDEHDDDDINGEEVRRAMETFKVAQGSRAAVSGIAFLMAVVGIWGDGY